MKRALFLPLSLFFPAVTAQAQTNFRPGYVVPLSGDTLRGQVDSRGAQRNARICRFRPDQSAPITEYRPRQLRGYAFTGGRAYQTVTVRLADSLERNSFLNVKADTLRRPSFLEVLVQGPASLLYLRDERDNDHFYLRMQGPAVQELVQTSWQVVENGVTYLRKSDEFRRTLAAATGSCLAVQPLIARIRYEQGGLMQVVQRYNECVGAVSVQPASEIRKNHLTLEVLAGGERSQLTIKDPGASITAKGPATSPVAGLGLSLQAAGVSRVVSFRVEALYDKQVYEPKADGPAKYSRNTSGLTYNEYRSTLESFRFPLLVRYTYPKGRLRPFVAAGLSFNRFRQNTVDFRSQYDFNGVVQTTDWKPVVKLVLRKSEQGAIGILGLTTARPRGHDAAVQVRYERSDAFNSSSGLKSWVDRFYLLLSYNLTR